MRPPDTLGFQPIPHMELENAIHSPNGVVLAVGPTGSGKTTLLYSALCTLLDGEKSVVSVEDPIEYDIPGINQVEHDPKVGVTFSNALRNILRQDPDIIMVGEIRDRETLQMTVEAAKTGHLVFSTLHTIDAWTAIMRLIDMGASPQDVSETLRAVVALRLVRIICPHCKEEKEPTSAERDLFERTPAVKAAPSVWVGKGCPACRNTGYLGRTGLFEVLVFTDELRSMVAEGASMVELRQASAAAGMMSLWEDGMQKVAEGITTVEEVMRSCRRPDEVVQKTE
jgi:type II secretory ATPase GspE/PulE/Tfp pilus assembly ATPase PilB-like protein